jgi:hypothetical protein
VLRRHLRDQKHVSIPRNKIHLANKAEVIAAIETSYEKDN